MIAVFPAAAVLSFVGVALVLPLLRRAQVMDVPNIRSSHGTPIPRGGGLAVVAAIVVANLVGIALNLTVAWPVLAAVTAFAAIGLLDDVRSLRVGSRLIVQLLLSASVVALILAESGVPMLVLTVAAIALAGYTNAFNFMDGVNGISAINAALAGGWFAFLGLSYGAESLAVLGLATAGAATGFLPWNAPSARVFLGDVGSYGLGFGVGASALLAWAAGVPLLLALAPLVVYGADTGWALIKRVLGRRPWHEAHREHVYQRLTDAGWPHLASGALPAACTALGCWLAIQIDSPLVLALSFACIAVAYLLSPRLVAGNGLREV